MLIDMFAAILAVLRSAHRLNQEVLIFGLASLHGLVILNDVNLARSVDLGASRGAKTIFFELDAVCRNACIFLI